MSFWCVVQTEARFLVSRKERPTLAEELFDRSGFETYLPKIQQRRAPGQWKAVALFPGYCFVRVVDRWYPIAWTPGVVRILMNGERPAMMLDNILDAIRDRERGGFVRLPKAPPPLALGARVVVRGGQFAGHVGLYDGQGARERERVLLELLGRSVRVVLGRGDRVEAAAVG